jgi:hypothetical protein
MVVDAFQHAERDQRVERVGGAPGLQAQFRDKGIAGAKGLRPAW